jgi:hypothetical protein
MAIKRRRMRVRTITRREITCWMRLGDSEEGEPGTGRGETERETERGEERTFDEDGGQFVIS